MSGAKRQPDYRPRGNRTVYGSGERRCRRPAQPRLDEEERRDPAGKRQDQEIDDTPATPLSSGPEEKEEAATAAKTRRSFAACVLARSAGR